MTITCEFHPQPWAFLPMLRKQKAYEVSADCSDTGVSEDGSFREAPYLPALRAAANNDESITVTVSGGYAPDKRASYTVIGQVGEKIDGMLRRNALYIIASFESKFHSIGRIVSI